MGQNESSVIVQDDSPHQSSSSTNVPTFVQSLPAAPPKTAFLPPVVLEKCTTACQPSDALATTVATGHLSAPLPATVVRAVSAIPVGDHVSQAKAMPAVDIDRLAHLRVALEGARDTLASADQKLNHSAATLAYLETQLRLERARGATTQVAILEKVRERLTTTQEKNRVQREQTAQQTATVLESQVRELKADTLPSMEIVAPSTSFAAADRSEHPPAPPKKIRKVDEATADEVKGLPMEDVFHIDAASYTQADHASKSFTHIRDNIDEACTPIDFDPDSFFRHERDHDVTSLRNATSPSSTVVIGPSSTASSVVSLDPCSVNDFSKIVLDSFQTFATLAAYERGYRTGRFSLDAVRQHLMMAKALMVEEDVDELFNSFEQLRLSDNQLLEPVAIAATTPFDTDPVVVDSVVQFLRTSVPPFGPDFCPDVAAEDDQDGLPRIRFSMIFSQPPAGSQPPATKKRKHEEDSYERATDEEIEAGVEYESAPHSNGATIFRSIQVNKAMERWAGWTQAEMAQLFKIHGQRLLFRYVRKDFVRGFHHILTKQQMAGITESLMYHVRVDRYQRESYCLVHFKAHRCNGVLVQGVQSVMELPPSDDLRAPPFVEGVDIDEETILHGYRPNASRGAD